MTDEVELVEKKASQRDIGYSRDIEARINGTREEGLLLSELHWLELKTPIKSIELFDAWAREIAVDYRPAMPRFASWEISR